MWQNNPNPGKWPAVVCYNKGWRVKNAGAISDVVDVNLKMGALHTDYDCMYIGRNNQFYTDGDGGYINVSPHIPGLKSTAGLLSSSFATATTAPSAATTAGPVTSPATKQILRSPVLDY